MNASPAARRKSVRWNAADVAKVRQRSPVTANVTANTPASSCAASFDTTGKGRKYRNTPTVVDGISFDSKAEMRRYLDLKLMLDAGEVSELQVHVPFALSVGGTLVCKYIADFVYTDDAGQRVVEDVKSPASRTSTYRLKRKLMLALYGIKIQEIMSCAT